ncbi:MAG: DUF4158 domain-containing protein [Acidobacteria bacterium]|nr:DUF4158 domain-containing protein [Acidobacteriota bacterium]
MASIERTAYPRFKRNPSSHDLNELHTPTEEETAFAQKLARSPTHLLALVILLKSFQRLGYLPKLEEVPPAIVSHLRGCLHLKPEVAPGYEEARTLYRHHRAIRDFLSVKAYGKDARHLAIMAVYDAAQTMDNPADLINVALETLVKERYELPAFSALDRLARRVRMVVNRRFWNSVLSHLTEDDRARLDALLVIDLRTKRSPFNRLKQLPKQPSLSHLQEWLDQLEWLVALGEATEALVGLPPLKVQHFAAEAKALDAHEMKDFTLPKRATLLLSLIQRQRVQARDGLALMLIKRMNKIQQRGKEELERLRVGHREKTAQLVSILADVVTACESAPTDAEAGHLVKTLLAEKGDTGQLLEDCETVVAASSDNYQPLLWPYYRSYRSTLFRLIKRLAPASTTQDQSLIAALNIVLENEDRRGDTLAGAVDLPFASERWQRTVYRIEDSAVLINRRHFEVCVFTHLAAELKSGDLSIAGSDEYADYREQLLDWEQCEPLVADYCRELELPATAQEFVAGLRTWLDETARQVDAGYTENGQLVIDEHGKPTLKRLQGREQPASVKELEAAELGLTLVEAKSLLAGVQRTIVEEQITEYLAEQSACPECDKKRLHKGAHTIVYRTLFGKLQLSSPRLFNCGCRPHTNRTFSPLAQLLTERKAPELFYLEAKFSALVSYGMTAKLLEEVLPVGREINAATARNHALKIGERLESELGDEQVFFIEGCERDWEGLPRPDLPLTVGIDGGYVHSSEQTSKTNGWFEVIVGKSMTAEGSSKCFGFVNCHDEKPKRRLFELLKSQG